MIARSRLQLARVAARAGAHSAHSSVLTCSHHNRRARLSRLQQRGAHAGSERCTSGPGDRWRPMRQAAARERCTSAQLRRSNSRRRAHLGPVRGSAREREGVRGSAGVPAPPGEPGVGERREAAGAGPGSSWGRGAQLQPARRGRRACGGGHARTGVLRGGARSEYCATAWRTGAAAARGGGAAWELLVPELTPPR